MPKKIHPDSVAIDAEGKRLPFSPAEVQAFVQKMIADGGEILAVIVKHGDDLACPVFGPPSRELLTVLETVTEAYRRALGDVH
jgi:hypothetical protein